MCKLCEDGYAVWIDEEDYMDGDGRYLFVDLFHLAEEVVRNDATLDHTPLECIKKAKALIKGGANVNKALSLCNEKVKYHEEYDPNHWDRGYDYPNASLMYDWILKIVNLIEQEKIENELIRVSVKKGLPMQSVNKIILSCLR